MQVKTAYAVLAAKKETVFDYLSRIENLPEWATEFCRELKVVSGRHKVVTCDPEAPEMFFEIRADKASGVIDMLAGPAPDQLWTFPTRVVDYPGGACVYLFTTIQAPGYPGTKFEREYQSLQKEFDNLRRRFKEPEALTA